MQTVQNITTQLTSFHLPSLVLSEKLFQLDLAIDPGKVAMPKQIMRWALILVSTNLIHTLYTGTVHVHDVQYSTYRYL